ncbi:MAG: VOC family protein [Casimicrobiaceae bacterium]
MIRGVHHISLATADLDRFLHFYRDLLGMKLSGVFDIEPGDKPFETVVGMQNTKGRAAALDLGNLHMEVFCYSHPQPQPGERRPACDVGIRHICFDVKDIFGEYERLQAAGVQAVSGPVRLAANCASVYLYDPDGNICELQEIFEGSIVPPAKGLASVPGQ